MTRKVMLLVIQNLLDSTKLTEEDHIILDAYFHEIPDTVIADKLGLKSKVVVRGKRQNICAKLGHTLINKERVLKNDLSFLKEEDEADR